MRQVFGRKIKLLEIDFVDKKYSRVADFRSRNANFRVPETLDDDGPGLEPVLVAPEDSLDHHLRGVSYRVVPRPLYHLPFLSIS